MNQAQLQLFEKLQQRLHAIELSIVKNEKQRNLDSQIKELKNQLQKQEQTIKYQTASELSLIKDQIIKQIQNQKFSVDDKNNFSHQKFYENHFKFLNQIQDQNLQNSDHQTQIQEQYRQKMEQCHQYQLQTKVEIEDKINELAGSIQEVFQENHIQYQDVLNNIHNNLHDNIQQVQDSHEEYQNVHSELLNEHNKKFGAHCDTVNKHQQTKYEEIQQIKLQLVNITKQQEICLAQLQHMSVHGIQETQDDTVYVTQQNLLDLEATFDLKIKNLNSLVHSKLDNQNSKIQKLNNDQMVYNSQVKEALNPNNLKQVGNSIQYKAQLEEAIKFSDVNAEEIRKQSQIIVSFDQNIKNLEQQLCDKYENDATLTYKMHKNHLLDHKIEQKNQLNNQANLILNKNLNNFSVFQTNQMTLSQNKDNSLSQKSQQQADKSYEFNHEVIHANSQFQSQHFNSDDLKSNSSYVQKKQGDNDEIKDEQPIIEETNKQVKSQVEQVKKQVEPVQKQQEQVKNQVVPKQQQVEKRPNQSWFQKLIQ